MSPPDLLALIKNFDSLPDDMVIPTKVTARVHNISERTVRRTYPSIQLSPGRKGQRVGDIRAMSRGTAA